MTSDSSVLVLNCGSSSVKFAVVDTDTGERRLSGLAERVGGSDTVMTVRQGDEKETISPPDGSYDGVLSVIFARLTALERVEICGVGHRVVHGGAQFNRSVVIDDAVLDAIRGVTQLAPLHLPANLAGIDAARRLLPDLAQVAVFDTAFHLTMPPRAYRYAVPTSWYAEHGVRRYGFHGTSHRYVSRRAAQLLGRPVASTRLVTAHLGNGCSAAAVRDGESVDTTMGLTPLEGLVMGTRSGDIDPGMLGYVGERLGIGLGGILDVLNRESGLLGLSEVSNDLRTVSSAADAGNPAAALAIELFCYRLAKYVAALVVPLERLDALVFTGGIGENSAPVRSAVLASLKFLGLEEDVAANAAHGRGYDGRITTPGGPQALVVPTDEELVIAQDTAELSSTDRGER